MRSKVTQKMAGHTAAAMTGDWYDHLLVGEKAEAIQALDSKWCGKQFSRAVDSEAGARQTLALFQREIGSPPSPGEK